MIQLNDIALSYGNQKIFDHISYIFNNDQHIGLVGANGAGKSTLLKAIVGAIQLDNGSISISKSTRIAYMAQDIIFESNKTVFDEALATFEPLYSLLQRKHELEKNIHDQHSAALVSEYGEITEQLHHMQPQEAIKKVHEILFGLGFKQEQLSLLVTQLSVGWKMRLVLAKLLLLNADFYLFDEPTNHLDIVAKDWFLQFLQQAPFGFLLVSHDRYFLDHACSEIFALERGNGTLYQGNYTQYLEQKERALQALELAYIQQQKEIKRKEETAARFRVSASRAQMSKNILKSIERMERIELPPKPPAIHFTVNAVQQPGKVVLTVNNVSFRFGDTTLFEHVSFIIERGQKVALVAPNGVGKTTLLSLIAGLYPLQQGTISLGYNVSLAFFQQSQHEQLDLNKTVFEQMLGTTSKKPEHIRTLLGAFLFDKEATEKKIKVLSGGEKNRLCMVQILLRDANFLILDEPTNHLDIQSKEILLQALQHYQGTILFVSHDRDFINHLATGIIDLNRHATHYYAGNYDEYVYHKKTVEKPQEIDKDVASSPKKPTDNNHALKRECKKLEQRIATLEQKIAQLHEKYAAVRYATQDYITYQNTLKALQEEHKKALQQWEDLAEKIL